MENLKIRVTTEQESKEVQELFFELGYGWHGKGKLVSYSDEILSNGFGWLVLWKPPYLTNTVIQMGSGFEDCKEITLQELRAMADEDQDEPFLTPETTLNDKIATAEVARQKEKHSHYKKDVSHLSVIDVYRVLELYGVESHAVGHAIKKLLCGGQRGAKGRKQDIQEAIDSLNRELEMVTEDEI
jgi:hypothetical protein